MAARKCKAVSNWIKLFQTANASILTTEAPNFYYRCTMQVTEHTCGTFEKYNPSPLP